MKLFKWFRFAVSCVLICAMLSVVLSGCALKTILEHREEIKNTTSVDDSSQTVSIDKNPELTADEYALLDNLARALYYAKFNSTDNLDDQIVLEYVSAILHDQDKQQKDYLIKPEKSDVEYRLEAGKCKSLVKALFNYDLGDSKIVNGNFVFPYAGGVTPEIAGRDTYPLEDGSFRMVYTVQAMVGDEYAINDIVTMNVIRIKNDYCNFRILSIMSADG